LADLFAFDKRKITLLSEEVPTTEYLIGLIRHVADLLVGVRLTVMLLLQERLLELLDRLGVTTSQRHQFTLQLADADLLLLLQGLRQNTP